MMLEFRKHSWWHKGYWIMYTEQTRVVAYDLGLLAKLLARYQLCLPRYEK